MPRLRGHHLICLHFFRGEGYDAEFVKNLDTVLKETASDPIKIVLGPDDVCGRCPHNTNDRCLYNEHADKEIREMDQKALDLLKFDRDAEIGWGEIREGLPAVFAQWYASYCTSCGWKKACEKSASYRELSVHKKVGAHPDRAK